MESLVKNVTDIILEEDKLRFRSQKDVSAATTISARGTGSAGGSTSLGSAPNANTDDQSNQAGAKAQLKAVRLLAVEIRRASKGSAVAKVGVYEQSVNVFANKETGVLIARATSRQHEKIQEFIDRVMMTANARY